MSDPTDPVLTPTERRRAARRRNDPPPPPQVEGERANLPAATAEAAAQRPVRRDGAAIFAAQVIGQEGQKRGLRGGAPVLDQARSTYLGNQYSGRRDRRPPSGTMTKTEI